MDKFILKKSSNTDGFKTLVINVPTHEKLMQIKEETGVSVSRIVSQMVDFCADRLYMDED